MPNHTVTIYSLTWSWLERSYSTTQATNVPIYIYDAEDIIWSVGGALGNQEVRAMTNYMSIQEWYKLVDENGKIYFVKKVRVKYTPIYRHLEIILSADYGTQLGS